MRSARSSEIDGSFQGAVGSGREIRRHHNVLHAGNPAGFISGPDLRRSPLTSLWNGFVNQATTGRDMAVLVLPGEFDYRSYLRVLFSLFLI